MIDELAENRRRHRRDIGTGQGRVAHMRRAANGGGEDFGREPVIVIDLTDLADHGHSIMARVVESADEGRDEGRACLGGEKRLIGGKAQRNVDLEAFARQGAAGFQPVPGERYLDGDVVGDLCEPLAFLDHALGFRGGDFGADRTLDHVADRTERMKPRLGAFGAKGWIGGGPVDESGWRETRDFLGVGAVDKQFHLETSCLTGECVRESVSHGRSQMKWDGVQSATSGTVSSEPGARVAVLLPLPLAGPYDYAVEGRPLLVRGRLVRAPLGARELLGVVWGRAEGQIAREKLRTALALEDHRLPENLCDFVDWVARYTLNPPGSVLAQALRVRDAFEQESPRRALMRGRETPTRLTEARKRVLRIMEDLLARMPAEIAELAGVSPGVVRSLADSRALKWVELPEFERCPEPDATFDAVKLSPDQLRAGEHLRDMVKKSEFAVALLDGVTGSGKTEAYFEGIAEALTAGRQVLILLPEIALTVQFLDRFATRFGCRPLEWHSDLSQRERRRGYRAVLSGDGQVVSRARSALFLPFAKLALLLVYEEHVQAYKQEEGVIYHARDMAVVRARPCALSTVAAPP